MSNNKVFYPRSFTPNPRELPQNNAQSDKNKKRNYESIYEQILSRGYPPVSKGKKGSANIVSKRVKSPKRNLKQNNKQIEKQSQLPRHSDTRGRLEERNSHLNQSAIFANQENLKNNNLKEYSNSKHTNIFLENFYRDVDDSIYLDLFNADEELRKLMMKEVSAKPISKIHANDHLSYENKQPNPKHQSQVIECSQNIYQGSNLGCANSRFTEQQQNKSLFVAPQNNFSFENNKKGSGRYQKQRQPLEAIDLSNRKDRGSYENKNAEPYVSLQNNYDFNFAEYPRYSYNHDFKNELSQQDISKNYNTNFTQGATNSNYQKNVQEHFRKLILHTPKKLKENSPNKNITATSLQKRNTSQSFQNYDSISQKISEDKYSEKKFTPQRYTHSSIQDNLVSQIDKGHRASYDRSYNYSSLNNYNNMAGSLNSIKDSYSISGKKYNSNNWLGTAENSQGINLAPAMSQDPIPSENIIAIKETTPLWNIKSNNVDNTSNGITLKLESDVVENASQRSNYEYRYQPNRDIDKIIEKSAQNKRRINLSVRRSRSSFAKGQEHYDYRLKEAEVSNRNLDRNTLTLDEIKGRLSKITSSSKYNLGFPNSNIEVSTSKDTSHSTTFNSEYNSLQSLSLNTNAKKALEWQPEISKTDQPSGSVFFAPNESAIKEKSIEGGNSYLQASKNSHTPESRIQTNRTESFIPITNTLQAAIHINVAELLSGSDQSDSLHQNYAHVNSRPLHTAGQQNPISNIYPHKSGTSLPKADKDKEIQKSNTISRHRDLIQANVNPVTRSRSESEIKKPFNISKEGKNEFLSNLKNFSETVMRSTKNFLTNKLSLTEARLKCSCSSNLGKDDTCETAMRWLMTQYKQSELPYLKKVYENIQSENDLDSKNKKQIKLDINRTFPESKYFNVEGAGQYELQRVLECFARYDPQIGYVQGMNFIAGNFLYHAEEYIAFWLLVMIFEKFEMRDIYQSNLPGLTKHVQIIDFLILNHIPNLYSQFCLHEIRVEMFCTEWVCGLFGSTIPIQKMSIFFNKFIQQGWSFFYRVVLALLLGFKEEMLNAEDLSEILLVFKGTINLGPNARTRNARQHKIDWEEIFHVAESIQIDEMFIHRLHTKFDPDAGTFNITANDNYRSRMSL